MGESIVRPVLNSSEGYATNADPERILVVDDDPDILRILKDNLELDGYRVFTAMGGKEALSLFEEVEPSLVLLDLSLPDIDGIQVCRIIRVRSSIPIIVLTARERVSDKVLGLDSGADDYLVKPFDYLELAARIRVCLRRNGKPIACRDDFSQGDLKMQRSGKVVWKGQTKIDVTQREFDLLLLLVRNSGKVMSRAEIRRALWPEGELYRDSRAIDVHVQHLRSKLEENPADPRFIKTVQGIGYVFTMPGD
jgi:DNA-binding response OmpR family regulator